MPAVALLDLLGTTPGPEPAASWTLGLPLPLLAPCAAKLFMGLSLSCSLRPAVKVEMEMVIQQYEKAKAIQDEQLERLSADLSRARGNAWPLSVLPGSILGREH